MEMKKCKECGKLFTPSNPRQQYCTERHFRPCPVCGKLVEIKYLSDPTPRCVDCRKMRKSSSAPSVVPKPNQSDTNELEATFQPSDYSDAVREHHIKKYTGRSGCGFVTGHSYLIRVLPNNPYGFLVEGTRDVTDEKDVNAALLISSMLSYHHFFV